MTTVITAFQNASLDALAIMMAMFVFWASTILSGAAAWWNLRQRLDALERRLVAHERLFAAYVVTHEPRFQGLSDRITALETAL